MKHHRPISSISSVLLVLSYVTFTLLALASYPLHFSPMTNWLSDLGSKDLNPSAALFYNVGIMITGLFLAIFFFGFSAVKLERNRVQNLVVLFAQIAGLVGALAMVMSALFPINLPVAHSFWSAALYIAIGTAFAFSVAALRYYQKCPRWILILGILAALTDMVASIFFGTVRILEWVIVALFLCYLLLAGLETTKMRYF
jgi:hypothetical membrane protein